MADIFGPVTPPQKARRINEIMEELRAMLRHADAPQVLEYVHDEWKPGLLEARADFERQTAEQVAEATRPPEAELPPGDAPEGSESQQEAGQAVS